MQKVKIIISTYDDIKNPNYGGGGAIAVHEVAKQLRNKFEITVLSWNHSGKKNEVIDGVAYERIGFSFAHPKIAMFVFQVILPFVSLLKKHDIWLESFSPPFTTSFMPLLNKKVVGIAHMIASEDMQRKYGTIIPFKKIERVGIRKYKHIIATNDNTKKALQSINPDAQITVIGNGVDRVANLKTRKIKSVLYLGRIEIDQKGLDLLIPAFKKLMALEDSYKLIIAGSGASTEIAKLKKLIKANRLAKNVVLTGWVYGKEKENLLSRSVALVVPSRFETYSMVILEAMAHGLPIVCFDIKGLKWVSRKVAIKVRELDEQKLAEAMLYIIRHSEKSEEAKRYGLNYASRFTWKKIGDNYQKYLEDHMAYV